MDKTTCHPTSSGVLCCCHHLSAIPLSFGPRVKKGPFSCVCGQPVELWDAAGGGAPSSAQLSSLDASKSCLGTLGPALWGTVLKVREGASLSLSPRMSQRQV